MSLPPEARFIEQSINEFVANIVANTYEISTDYDKLEDRIKEAEDLLEVYHRYNTSGVSPAVIQLTRLINSLTILAANHAQQTARMQKSIRVLSRREQFKAASLEKEIAGLKERIAKAPSPILRDNLEASLRVAEGEYEDLLAVRCNARDAEIRRAELEGELKLLPSRIQYADERAAAILQARADAISEELTKF